LRSRQSININPDSKELSPKQENALVKKNKDMIPELLNVPVTSFDIKPSFTQQNMLIKGIKNKIDGLSTVSIEDMALLPPESKQMGIFGIGLLAPRTNIPHEYITSTVSPRNIPIISKISTSNYFFIIYDNPNIARITIESTVKSFAVIKTLSQCTVRDCSEMLRLHYTNITAISEDNYLTGIFEHPKYCDDSGYPLQIRYAEIPIIKQKTPGRLDNIPLGYPDFDTTPDGVTTRKGPVPSPPYPDFSWLNEPPIYTSQAGATSSGSTINVTNTTGLTAGMYVSIKPGGTGSLNPNTRVISVINKRKFTISPSPIIPLAGTRNVITAYLPLNVSVGASASFVDSSVKSPWQFAPTGWNWVFGASASPTGSTGKNPTTVYNYPGIYTVTMTASNASGSTTKTKTNFVIVT
jgi:hypothetical protein